MTKKEKSIIEDMISYMIWAKDQRSFMTILANISHDIRGIVSKDEYFLPRTSGWGKKEKTI